MGGRGFNVAAVDGGNLKKMLASDIRDRCRYNRFPTYKRPFYDSQTLNFYNVSPRLKEILTYKKPSPGPKVSLIFEVFYSYE